MKKTGLGRDPLNWIKPTSEKKKPVEKEIQKRVLSRENKKEREYLPKFKTFDVRLTSLLRDDQLEFLERLIRDIRKNRTSEYRKERITKNTLIRVFIDAFMDKDIDTANISDEKDLLKRIRKM
jgi:hypothetical protein